MPELRRKGAELVALGESSGFLPFYCIGLAFAMSRGMKWAARNSSHFSCCLHSSPFSMLVQLAGASAISSLLPLSGTFTGQDTGAKRNALG